MIAKLAETLLLRVGKEGVARLLSEPLLEKAATNTQLDFEGLEIRDALLKWSQSQNLIEILEDLKEGKRPVADPLVPGFLETTDFLTGEDTESQARAVIEAFLK